jgi:DNA-binding beta-propeller fold protein YncE
VFVTTNWGTVNEQVFAIDPENGQTRYLWTGGAELDAVASPDSARLYVTYIGDHGYELAVVETGTGAIIGTVETPQLIRWIFPSHPGMAISSDGRWLYLLKTNYSAGPSAYSVLTFDTVNLRFTPEEQLMPDCPRPHVVPVAGESKFYVVCDGSTSVHDPTFVLRCPRAQNFALARAGNRRTVYMAGFNGWVDEVDLATHEIIRTSTQLRSRRIMPSSETLSVDGRLWYLPVKIPNNGEQDIEQILTFDTHAMQMKNVITPTGPFWGLALSLDGRSLYASQPELNSILVIDTETRRTTRTLAVAGRPAIVFAGRAPVTD